MDNTVAVKKNWFRSIDPDVRGFIFILIIIEIVGALILLISGYGAVSGNAIIWPFCVNGVSRWFDLLIPILITGGYFAYLFIMRIGGIDLDDDSNILMTLYIFGILAGLGVFVTGIALGVVWAILLTIIILLSLLAILFPIKYFFIGIGKLYKLFTKE